MGNIVYIRDASGNWQGICGCKIRKSDGTWSDPVVSGTMIRNNEGSWDSIVCPVGILVVDIFTNTTINAYAYIKTPGATEAYNIPAYTGSNFVPNDGTPAADCFILASDVGEETSSWRFEWNIQKLEAMYPEEPTFVLAVGGRDTSSGTISGDYDLKGSGAGVMTMSGSSGSYFPSTSSAVNLGLTNYSGKATVGGADGTYGIGIGADILVFTYTVATGSLTLA